MQHKQLSVFLAMLVIYSLATFFGYAFYFKEMTTVTGLTPPIMSVSPLVMGLASAVLVFVLYGVFGLVGSWFAGKLGLPGIYSPDRNWRQWFLVPFVLGILCGLALIVGDIIFAPINGIGRFPHPLWPASFFASITAGIGEEIAFRSFIFGLWALILNFVLRRFNGRKAALWIANIIAALAFGAGHLGLIFLVTGASDISQVNPLLLFEVFLLNGLIGLVAGQRYMRDGLVAAAGVHFWTDIVFHVIWGLLA